MKKIMLIMLWAFSLMPLLSYGFEIKTWEDFTVAESINDDYYVAWWSIIIDSQINWDLIIAWWEIKLKGNVENDVNVVWWTVYIKGNVWDDIRVAWWDIHIDWNVGWDLIGFGWKIFLGSESNVSGDILMAWWTLDIQWTINWKAKIHADKIILNWVIGKDVELSSNSIQVWSNAKILWDLNYKSNTENQNLKWIVSWETKYTQQYYKKSKDKIMWFITWFLLIKIMFLTIFWSILVIFGKKIFNWTNAELKTNPWRSLLRWFLLYISIPFAIILSFITVVWRPIWLLLILWYLALFLLGEIIWVTVFSSLVISNLQQKSPVAMWKKLLIVAWFAILFGLLNWIDLIAIFFAVWALMAVKFNVVKQWLENIENKE